MAKSIDVLVIDDSAFMRKVIRDILESAHDIKVAGAAKNGLEALDMAREINPDVITLDLNMPSMDGLTCLRELQKITEAPVIMLSSLTTEGGKATIEALESGAIDFITKPTNIFDISGEQKKAEIIKKIRMAYSFSKKKQVPQKAVWPGQTEAKEQELRHDRHRHFDGPRHCRWHTVHPIYRLPPSYSRRRPGSPVAVRGSIPSAG